MRVKLSASCSSWLLALSLLVPRPVAAQKPYVPTDVPAPGHEPLSARGEYLTRPLRIKPGQVFPPLWTERGLSDSLLAQLRGAWAHSLILLDPKSDEDCNPMIGRAAECMSHFKVKGELPIPDATWWEGLLDIIATPDTLFGATADRRRAREFRPELGVRFIEPASGRLVEVLFSFGNHELMAVESGHQSAAALRSRARAMYAHLARVLSPGVMPPEPWWRRAAGRISTIRRSMRSSVTSSGRRSTRAIRCRAG